MFFNYFKALTAKTVLIFSTFFIFILIVLAISVYEFTLKVMEKENNKVINIEYEYLINTYLNYGTQKLIVTINQRSKNQNTAIYLATDQLYNKLAGNLNSWPQVEKDNEGYISFVISRMLGSEIITHTSRAKIVIFPNGTKLLVGRDIQPEILISNALINLIIFTIIFIMVAAIIGSALLGRYTLTKVNILNTAIQNITDNDLNGRINNKKINNEYKQISTNVNRMLQRIDELVDSSKNISGNIAHDLKKPLTKLKTNLELASIKVTNKNSIKFIEDSIIEADNLIKIFNALLDIASFESEKKQDFKIFNLSNSINSLIEIYSPVFEDNNIKLKSNINKNLNLLGNKILLTQAFTNILDNSIKYALNEKTIIEINLIKTDTDIKLEFIDNGGGIDENDHSKVFDRFVRLEKHRQTNGNGLGLSMVKAIVKLHDANISLSNNTPGLIVKILFTDNN
ncbi:MAG: HAMP domain-containing sensor histidine kinase [Alphaproteobacteria bacterium]|jgi:signal transduction histidine kinase|nr:HAMP domain-containing histidine kinase [Pelagibacterales bacterium]MDG2267846.1 HAMP domain-containing sensor histidine kinase [Alphaproteobacteria bacterium]